MDERREKSGRRGEEASTSTRQKRKDENMFSSHEDIRRQIKIVMYQKEEAENSLTRRGMNITALAESLGSRMAFVGSEST
jgi:hypothetical protein